MIKKNYKNWYEAVNNSPLCAFIASAILAVITFRLLYGFRVVDPTYTDWIFIEGGDMTQHHLGWLFFRKTPWKFPIGLIDDVTCTGSVSCMYTDSIPIFAIFFKLLSPILPENFQYIGIWGLTCYILNGGLSAILLRKFRKNIIFTTVGSLFYILFPPSMFRIFHHDSLIAIWLLIIPLIMCVYHDKKWKHKATPVIIWTVTGMLAVQIHSYFVPMIYMAMVGYFILDIGHTKKFIRSLLVFASTTVFTLFTMWIIGAFYGEGNVEESGLGYFNSNMNCLVNSFGYSKFLVPMNAMDGQYEGFGYLGLGSLLCIFLALVTVFCLFDRKEGKYTTAVWNAVKKYKFELIAFVTVFLLSFLFAMSVVVTLNRRELYTINLPGRIHSKLSIFRASGRFVWLAGLLLITAALGIVSKLGKHAGLIAIIMCMCVQVLDLRPWRNNLYNHYSVKMNYSCTLSNEKWNEIADGADEIIFTPLPPNYLVYHQLYFDFAQLAENNDMALSSFYLARADYNILAEYAAEQYEDLKNGNGRDDALYVFFNKEDVPQNVSGLEVYELDGYIAARYKG